MTAFFTRHIRRCAVAILVVVCVVVAVSGCGTRAPSIPSNQTAIYNTLIGSGAQKFLDEISAYNWDDEGAKVANALSWIYRDAQSSDPEVAARAGSAAHSIAMYLSTNHQKLMYDLPSGMLGLSKESLSARNPELLRGFAAALEPYQGAMIGKSDGTRGFDSLISADNYAAARNIFAVISTNTEIGNTFAVAAYQKSDDYSRQANQNAAGSDLRFAAALAGAVYGGAQEAANDAVKTRNAQQAIDYAAYNLAASRNPEPGDFDKSFFTADGKLKSIDQVTGEDMKIHYSEQLQIYIGHIKELGMAMNRFEGEFNRAAGIHT